MSKPNGVTDLSLTASSRQRVLRSQRTSQDNVLTELQSALSCNICLDQLCDPRTLPCQHTFCASCIQQLIRASATSNDHVNNNAGDDNNTEHTLISIRCPLKCSQPLVTTTDEGAAQRLPINYVAARVLEATGQLRLCPVDNNMPLNHYCLTHGKFHCIDCKIEWNCRVLPIREAAEEMQARIKHGSRQAKAAITETEEWISCRLTSIEKREITRNTINEAFDTLEACLRNRRNELLQQLDMDTQLVGKNMEHLLDVQMATVNGNDSERKSIVQQLLEQQQVAEELEHQMVAGRLSTEALLERGQQLLDSWNNLMPSLEAWYKYAQTVQTTMPSYQIAIQNALSFIQSIGASTTVSATVSDGELRNTRQPVSKHNQPQWRATHDESNAPSCASVEVTLQEASDHAGETISLHLPVNTLIADLDTHVNNRKQTPARNIDFQLHGKSLPRHWNLANCNISTYDIITYTYTDVPTSKKPRFL